MENAFDQVLRNAHLGDVEVLADAALAAGGGSPTDGPVARNVDFTNADDVHFGVSNNKGLPTNCPANSEVIIQNRPSTPYRPRAMVIASEQCPGLYIRQIEYGPFRFIDGSCIPASAHSEVSLNQFIRWPTIQTSSDVTITLYNDTALVKNVAVDFRGTRVRA